MIQLQQQYFFCGCDNGFQALFYNVSAAKFEEETTKNINLLLGGFPVWEMIMQTEFQNVILKILINWHFNVG